MITNKDIRVENGNLVLNGDKFPLDGQSPETIMEIVEDNSDTTPTENSTAPVTSGGVYTALGTKQDDLTFDSAPTENSANPVTSGGVYTADKAISYTIGDITQTGITGASVAAQLGAVAGQIGNLKFAVFEQTFTDVDITTAWGSLYESATPLEIDISSLDLQTTPKMALIGVQTAWTEFFTTPAIPTATAVSFRPLRPASTTGVRIVATALVIY